MPLESPTDPLNSLCMDSYAMAQAYVEWRLEGSESLYRRYEELHSTLPPQISQSILATANEYEQYGQDVFASFPVDVYHHCERMWDKSREFIIAF